MSRQITNGGIHECFNQLISDLCYILFRHRHLFQYPFETDGFTQFVKCIEILVFVIEVINGNRHNAMCQYLDMIIPAKIVTGFIGQRYTKT